MPSLSFLFKGRLNQVSFTTRLCLFLSFNAIFYYYYIPSEKSLNGINFSVFNLGYILGLLAIPILPILGLVYFLSLYNRRLHDLGYSNVVLSVFATLNFVGFNIFFILSFFGEGGIIGPLGLLILPYINLLFLAFLIFKPGSKEANKYGPACPTQTNYFLNFLLGLLILLSLIIYLNLSYFLSLFTKQSLESATTETEVLESGTLLSDGMEVTANKLINIKAGKGLLRTYELHEGFSKCIINIKLKPQTSTETGEQGIYVSQAVQKVAGNLTACDFIDWISAKETEKDFQSENEVVDWIKKTYTENKETHYTTAYNNSGLIIAWRIDHGKGLFVEIWQPLINGQKPKALEGADDISIQIN